MVTASHQMNVGSSFLIINLSAITIADEETNCGLNLMTSFTMSHGASFIR